MEKSRISLRQLTVSALLIAFDVIFTRVLALNTPLVKMGFGFAAVAVGAMLYGPAWTALTAALGDLVGARLFPTGAYFPGFTLTAALTGLLFGLCLYRRPVRLGNAFLAAFLNCLIVTLILNTAQIVIFFHASLEVLLASRVPQFFIMAAIQTLVIRALGVSPALLAQIRGKKPPENEKKP